MEAQDRYAPLSAPVPVHAEQETQTPPPPLLTREQGLRKKKGHAPHSRAMGARQVSPRRSYTEEDTRDKHPQPPLLFARKGSRGTRCGTGQDTDTRRGTAWGKARATPLPPSQPGTVRNASGDATAPLPVCARGDENGRASTPLAPRRRLHVGSARMGGALQPGAAPPSPRVGARGNARTGTRKSGAPPQGRE
ncbi:hypothetical protein EDB84DRAFT_1570110 [Lactarius hengduanensis]|nr:hypothetical protein EDB84DRAFT_1570110 [Lactarius hengduanensis]